MQERAQWSKLTAVPSRTSVDRRDGNVFNLIAIVSKALEQAGLSAADFQHQAFSCHSYGEVRCVIEQWVEVE